MDQRRSNPCSRCGTERVVAKTWEEKVQTLGGVSVITHTVTVCPDSSCQKVVDEQMDLLRQKQEQRKQAFALRKAPNKVKS